MSVKSSVEAGYRRVMVQGMREVVWLKRFMQDIHLPQKGVSIATL